MKKIENLFRIIQNTPWCKSGELETNDVFTNNVDFNDYPKIYSQAYETSDGVKVCLNDEVYRIVNKDLRWLIKTVRLSESHLNLNTPFEIYGNKENAEKALKEIEDKIDKECSVTHDKQIIEQILLFAKVKVEETPPKELQRKFDNILSLAKQLRK